MEYMSVRDASGAWGVSERQVQLACRGGRVPDAIRFGRSWAIPAGAPKPADRRRKKTPRRSAHNEAVKPHEVEEPARNPQRGSSDLPSPKTARRQNGIGRESRKREVDAKAEGSPHTLLRACPNPLMTDLFCAPGDALAVAEELPSAVGERDLALGYLRYLQGDLNAALSHVRTMQAFIEQARLESLDKAIPAASDATQAGAQALANLSTGCGLLESVCAMYAGDVALWDGARAMIESAASLGADQSAMTSAPESASAPALASSAPAPASPAQATAFWLAAMDSALFDHKGFSQRFRRGDFAEIPRDSFPSARFFFAKCLLAEASDLAFEEERQRSLALASVCPVGEALISQTRLERVYVAELYLHLVVAVAYNLQGDAESTGAHIDAAIALALPDGLISPLAEHLARLDFALSHRLREVDPGACDRVLALAAQLKNGWVPLRNTLLGLSTSTLLTTRERQISRMALSLTNQQIAERLGIATATVKRTLTNARAKTGACSRGDLAHYI